jgi:hypothetical protein
MFASITLLNSQALQKETIYDFSQNKYAAWAMSMYPNWRQLRISWMSTKRMVVRGGVYENKFLDLMAKRRIEDIDQQQVDGSCLLCSEDKPHHCHRRLVAEYLREKWSGVEIVHL